MTTFSVLFMITLTWLLILALFPAVRGIYGRRAKQLAADLDERGIQRFGPAGHGVVVFCVSAVVSLLVAALGVLVVGA